MIIIIIQKNICITYLVEINDQEVYYSKDFAMCHPVYFLNFWPKCEKSKTNWKMFVTTLFLG